MILAIDIGNSSVVIGCADTISLWKRGVQSDSFLLQKSTVCGMIRLTPLCGVVFEGRMIK